jgi:hypothetical protein
MNHPSNHPEDNRVIQRVLNLLLALLKGRKEREQSWFPISSSVVAAAQEKFQAGRSSEAVQANQTSVQMAISAEPTESNISPLTSNESIESGTLSARILAALAWLWLVVALPFAAVLSVGLLVLWNVVTFSTLTEDNSILGHGPLPHELHERFLALWFMAGFVWLIVLISATVQRSSFRMAVSLAALIVCFLAWLINAAGWAECIAAC